MIDKEPYAVTNSKRSKLTYQQLNDMIVYSKFFRATFLLILFLIYGKLLSNTTSSKSQYFFFVIQSQARVKLKTELTY